MEYRKMTNIMFRPQPFLVGSLLLHRHFQREYVHIRYHLWNIPAQFTLKYKHISALQAIVLYEI